MGRTSLVLLLLAPVALAAPVPKGLKSKKPSVAEAVLGEWESVTLTHGMTTRATFAAGGAMESYLTIPNGQDSLTELFRYATAEADADHPLGRVGWTASGAPGGPPLWVITALSREVLEFEDAGGRTIQYRRVKGK